MTAEGSRHIADIASSRTCHLTPKSRRKYRAPACAQIEGLERLLENVNSENRRKGVIQSTRVAPSPQPRLISRSALGGLFDRTLPMARQQVEKNRTANPKYIRVACDEAHLRMDHLRYAVTRLLRGARDLVQPQDEFFGPPACRSVGALKRRVALLGILTGGVGRPGSARATEPPSVYPSAETTASRVIDISAEEMLRQEAIRRRGLEMLRADFSDPPLPRGNRLELPAQAADLTAMRLAAASASGASPAAAPSAAPAQPQQSSPLEAAPLIQPGDAKVGDAKAGDSKAGDAKAGDSKPRNTKAGPGSDQRTAAFRAALAAEDKQEKPEKAVAKDQSDRSEESERAYRHHASRHRRHHPSREARAEHIEISREQLPAAATTQQSASGQSSDWVKRMQDAVAPSSLKSSWDNLWTKPAAAGG